MTEPEQTTKTTGDNSVVNLSPVSTTDPENRCPKTLSGTHRWTTPSCVLPSHLLSHGDQSECLIAPLCIFCGMINDQAYAKITSPPV